MHAHSHMQRVAKMTEILDFICRYYQIDLDMLRGKQRGREVIWPRQIAMYLLREETHSSLAQIGTMLGGRDHTTVMHGLEKVHIRLQQDEHIRHEIATIRTLLRKRYM